MLKPQFGMVQVNMRIYLGRIQVFVNASKTVKVRERFYHFDKGNKYRKNLGENILK